MTCSEDLAFDGSTIAVTSVLTAPVVRIRRELAVRLILADGDGRQAAVVDPARAGLLGRACAARQAVFAAPERAIDDHARDAGLTPAYFTRLLRLPWLDPDLIAVILDGRPPPTLTREQLARATHPLSWYEQRTMFAY